MRPGHRGDAPVAAELIGDFQPEIYLADPAYDSDAIRALLISRGATPVIPNNRPASKCTPSTGVAYRLRNIIERTFCRLKD